MTDFGHYLEVMKAINARWTPHAGQREIGRALFGAFNEVMAVCGRNFGKTDFIIYALYRVALLNPGTQNYYFAPEQKQAREILWKSNRLQSFLPEYFAGDPNETEMRIILEGGSFIKLDGSDNVDQYRGVKPEPGSLIVYDEYKDFRREFHQAMDPNLQHAKLLVMGTPPEFDNHFTEMEDEFKSNPKKAYFNMPSEIAPHNSKEWLERKKAELYAKGEADVWEREYMARRVRGGKNAIFPMIGDLKMTEHRVLYQSIVRDLKKLEWFCIADPGTTTCFAVLFGAINRYTKDIYLLDCVYETQQARTSVGVIGELIGEKENELGQGRVEWDELADEAAAWFINEMYDRFGKAFRPTEKSANKKETGLSLIKDALLRGKIKVSDRCGKLLWEMQNYVKDEHGRIPKENDHLIDCLRYMLAAANYQLENEAEPIPESAREEFRGARFEDDFPELEGVRADEFFRGF